MNPVLAIDLSNSQSTPPDDTMALKVVQNPFFVSSETMKPDGVVEAGSDEGLAPGTGVLGERRM